MSALDQLDRDECEFLLLRVGSPDGYSYRKNAVWAKKCVRALAERIDELTQEEAGAQIT